MIDRYISYLRDVRRYSERTQVLYKAALEDFALWAETPGQAGGDGRRGHGGDGMKGQAADAVMPGLTWHLVPSRIREYEAHLIEKGLKPRTVHLRISAISGYCNFLVKEGVIKSNPVKNVKRPKMEKRLPEFFTDKTMQDYLESSAYDASQEQLEIMQSADSGSKFAEDLYNRRLRRLIISMLYGTGIRRAEIIGLKRGSVDFSRASLRVRGKGDKMREIPLVPSLVQEISLYLKAVSSIVGEVSSADAPLLVTDKGKPLYPEFVDRAVKKELDGTGATGRKSPHVLRHSLATALLDGGADLNAIKEMLGHSSLAATEVYTHNTVERLKAQYMNAHPRAKNKDSND